MILLEPGLGKGQDGMKMCGYVQGRARVEAGCYTRTAVVEFYKTPPSFRKTHVFLCLTLLNVVIRVLGRMFSTKYNLLALLRAVGPEHNDTHEPLGCSTDPPPPPLARSFFLERVAITIP